LRVLRLYDTRAREARDFAPVTPGRAGIYVCGPTVQAPPHVGHARSAVAFDVLRRWLAASGYDVTFVRNVTDIDDKIIHEAGHTGQTPWAVAEANTRAFNAAYDALGILAPTVEPRATGHVPEMVDLMRVLIDKGHAYPSGGDVYFDVGSFGAYGELSGQRPDAMMATEKVDATRPKRSPLDFALWKAHKPGEPFWDTPWGPGRPGWHLECSAMSVKYLGQPFDIHGGGLDLVFPHHENENAQSACAGDGFANYWLHNGLVNTGGEKMSKSLGNSLVVADVLASGVRPVVLRYLLGGAHYRSNIEYSDALLVESAAAYARIETFVRNAGDTAGARDEDAWASFAAAMDDDLAVSRALGVVHTVVGRGNAALADGDAAAVATCRATVVEMLAVLGLDPVSQWPAESGDLHGTLDALVAIALEARSAARARKDFAEADAIRDRLTAAGVVVEDTAGGVRWHLGSA
jgi:cysteinyl-tRNA synthetase